METDLYLSLDKYFELNSERLTLDEKEYLRISLKYYLDSYNNLKDINTTYMLYDFFTYLEKSIFKPRHEIFGEYILRHFPAGKFNKVADIAAGRMCRLSEFLTNRGYDVTAYDYNIRINEEEQKKFKTKKQIFLCSETSQLSTDLSEFDLIVGLEPCGAGLHIISEGFLKNKTFAVALCNGNDCVITTFDKKILYPKENYHNYLLNKYEKLKIEKFDRYHIATNKEFLT